MGLMDAIFRRGRKASDDVAKAIDVDDVTKGKMAIEDSKKEIAKFTSEIASLRAAQKQNTRALDAAKADVAKYQGIYDKIKAHAGTLKDGNTGEALEGKADELAAARKDGQQALDALETAQKTVSRLEADIKRDGALFEQMQTRLQQARQKVSNAEQNVVSLAARQRSAAIRTKFAKAQNGLSEGKGLSALDDLERSVEQSEAEAESFEEMAGVGNAESLEDKYGGSGASVDF